jgi:hypothetical protein
MCKGHTEIHGVFFVKLCEYISVYLCGTLFPILLLCRRMIIAFYVLF